MHSHIHELWEELDMPEEYPELDPESVLARVNAALGQDERPGKQPMKSKIRFTVLLAAAFVLLTGTALAVSQNAGFLSLFFRGDTSQLEDYVQTAIDSAENEDYRLSINSALYDGQNIYAVVTAEALNDQAAEDLMSNRVIAESHRETWGDAMADQMLESGSAGPDTCMYDFTRYLGGLGISELPHPTDTSRSWKVNIHFQDFVGEADEPLELWLGFMGREYAVHIPLDKVLDSIHLEPREEILYNSLSGQTATLLEVTFNAAQLSYRVECSEGGPAFASALGDADGAFLFRMRDGTILSHFQSGAAFSRLHHDMDASDKASGREVYTASYQFTSALNLTQIEAIIFGTTAFPVDGSAPYSIEVDEHLRPFFLPCPDGWTAAIPVEELCARLGAELEWDAEHTAATASFRGVSVVLSVGSSEVSVDGQPVEMDWLDVQDHQYHPYPATMLDGQLYAQLGVFRDAWGFESRVERVLDDSGDTTGYSGYVVVP